MHSNPSTCSSQDSDDNSAEDGHASPSCSNGAAETACLCLCAFTNAYLQLSVFPYSGFMTMALIPTATKDSAAIYRYAGILSSSFMFGRFLSSYLWGQLADSYGRIFVLQSTLLLSGLVSLLFGTSQSFAAALFFRTCLGLVNGIIGTIKTVASEIQQQHTDTSERERHQLNRMGLILGMRSWGFLVSPALGGCLAEPLQQYPDFILWKQTDSYWGWLLQRGLTRYPFFLPNLVGAILCFTGAIVVTLNVQETLPTARRQSPKRMVPDALYWIYTTFARFVRSLAPSGGWKRAGNVSERTNILLHDHHYNNNSSSSSCSYSTATSFELQTNQNDSKNVLAIWKRPRILQLFIVMWFLCFIQSSLDEAFPLFCMAPAATGGLGLPEASIGKILSAGGLLFALSQYFVFSTAIHQWGVYAVMTATALLTSLPAMLLPLSLWFNRDAVNTDSVAAGTVTWATLAFLSVVVALVKLSANVFFSAVSVLLNKTVDSSERARMNALGLVGTSAFRGMGPLVGGVIVSLSYSSSVVAPLGSVIFFSVLSLPGVPVAIRVRRIQACVLQQQAEKQLQNQSVASI